MNEGENQEGAKGGASSKFVALLEKAGEALVPILISGASLIGFVAFAGAVMVWTRFFAVEVPPDQAVKAVPRAELVATGSSLLLLFGFFGVLAVLAMYLVDRGGRATPGMSRGLLALAALEGVVAIAIVSGKPLEETIQPILLFLLLVGGLLVVTFTDLFVRREDTLTARPYECLDPKVSGGLFRGADGKLRDASNLLTATGLLALAVVLATLVATLRLPAEIEIAVLVAVGAALLAAAYFGFRSRVEIREIVKSVAYEEEVMERRKELERTREAKTAKRPEDERLWRRRPHRLSLTLWGALVAGVLAVLAVVLPSLRLGEWWLGASLGVATALAFGLWRVACLSRASFLWFGLAVFLSVPLFGTLTLMGHNLFDPQVQPMALIRESDGPDEAIQGLYVTEADDRVYFANVATEGCEDDITASSGRLHWVPKSEVVAMSIGPLQDVEDAAESALEMAYALTPAVETPGGENVDPDAERQPEGEEQGEEAEEAGGADDGRRLESAGPAVRPNFGSGLRLVPPIASPGKEVSLRLSTPNAKVDGFGDSPAGHTLRLDGVPVRILREAALQARRAEYVKAEDGTVLALDKAGLYGERTLDDGRVYHYPLEDHPRYEGTLFVKLEDSAVLDARAADGDPTGVYLAVDSGGSLLRTPEVELDNGLFVPLRTRLLRQAWDEEEIRFRVPEGSLGGVLTVDCGQLAGQPFLRVSRPPVARIAVRMEAGTGRVVFDSRRSSDDARIASLRWTIGGLPRGEEPKLSRRLPPRLAPYRVRLTVTDRDGEADTAQLHLMRLPAPFFPSGRDRPEGRRLLRRIRAAVVRAGQAEPPVRIEVSGHADNVGSSADNVGLSMRRAANVRDDVLTPAAAARLALADGVPVRTRAFGESCPLDPSGGSQRVNRRVEIFILGQDTQLIVPRGCRVGRTTLREWSPTPPAGRGRAR